VVGWVVVWLVSWVVAWLVTVKTAKQNLSKAKDAYSAYQQDLAQQQTQLQDLQAKLEADIGFIEQIDISRASMSNSIPALKP
jgi:flagellar biosynthesis/type III secretory pathway M-ring protein FliF/YscJ